MNAPTIASIPDDSLYDADALMAMARQATGLDDFGPEPFQEALKRLLAALRDEAQLSAVGAQNQHLGLLKSLTDRLQIQAAINTHPEILAEPIVRPLVITGLWRTGSTKLQRVIAKDPRWRSLPLWQALHPVPFPGEAAGDGSQRIAATQAMVDGFRTFLPQAYAAHPIMTLEPEEEIGPWASQMQIQSMAWFGITHVPGYMNWVLRQPMTDAYRWLKKTLQYLQWQDRAQGKRGVAPRRWLLKAPFHLGYIANLADVFPDVDLVQCHRRPLLDGIASISSLINLGRSMSSTERSLLDEAQELLGYFAQALEKQMGQRRALGSARLIDVDYRDIRNHCAALVGRIYAHVDVPCDDATTAAIARWESENPQHAHGKFLYDAAACGLTLEEVDQTLGEYAIWLAEFSAGYRPAT